MSKITTQEYTESFFKSNKDYHYNLQETAEDYQVSSGSLILDSYLGGGFAAGVHRFVGANEGGKTNEALQVMHNMLKTVDCSKGLFIKAEGRLSSDVQKRSGLKFVLDPKEWDEGTCLVFECNVFDTVFDYLRGLLKNAPKNERFCIVIDSMDGLLPKAELEKTTSDAAKVAAGALMTSDFLKRVSIGMAKFGHICILISQVRSSISVTPYAKGDPNNQTNSSGGNAALHYPDWILQFGKQNKSDRILEKQNEQPGPQNKILGHQAKILICKSTNETTGQTVAYPIKHGRLDGKSIWVEREVVEMLMQWEFIKKSGAWFSFEEDAIEFAKENGIELTPKFQGMASLYKYLEDDENVMNVLKNLVKKEILQ